MKKLLAIYIAAGIILTTVAPALADDVLPAPWAGEDRTVFAAWGTWTDFPGPMSPDYWGSNPEGLDAPSAVDVAETPVLLSLYEGRSNIIELNEDYELRFDMPNFAEGEYKNVWIQVTYFPTTQEQYPLFDIDAEGQSSMTEQVFEDFVEWENGWVTDAWSFQIWPNPEGEEIALNFAGGYPAYVAQVVIDTICIPEPATICLLGLGGLGLVRRRR